MKGMMEMKEIKKLSVIVLSVIIAVLSSSVSFAQSPAGQGGMSGQAGGQQPAFQNREEFANKREEFSAFRERLQQHRELAIERMKENNSIRAENARLLGEFRDSLELLAEEGTVLSDETLEAIHQYMEQIRAHRDALKDTHQRIRNLIRANGEFRSKKDYASLENSFSQIADMQLERNAIMLEINEDISEMLKLLVSEV